MKAQDLDETRQDGERTRDANTKKKEVQLPRSVSVTLRQAPEKCSHMQYKLTRSSKQSNISFPEDVALPTS